MTSTNSKINFSYVALGPGGAADREHDCGDVKHADVRGRLMPSRSGQAKSLSCDQAHIDTSRWMHRAAGTVMNAPGAGLQGPASTAARNGMTLDRRRGPAYGL